MNEMNDEYRSGMVALDRGLQEKQFGGIASQKHLWIDIPKGVWTISANGLDVNSSARYATDGNLIVSTHIFRNKIRIRIIST